MLRRDGRRIGFGERISRGWKITKLGMAVVRADPELIVYTSLSALFSLMAIGAAISGSVGLDAVASDPECVVKTAAASWLLLTWQFGSYSTC